MFKSCHPDLAVPAIGFHQERLQVYSKLISTSVELGCPILHWVFDIAYWNNEYLYGRIVIRQWAHTDTVESRPRK